MVSALVAHIDLDRLVANYQALAGLVGSRCGVCAVLKADAYGHGLPQVAQTLHQAGAQWFAVATLDEAVALRGVCPAAKILVLLPTLVASDREAGQALVEYDLRPTVTAPAEAVALEGIARRWGRPLAIHVEIDTGMGRMGIPAGRSGELLQTVADSPYLKLEGVFTHFADADDGPPEATEEPLAVFAQCVRAVAPYGVESSPSQEGAGITRVPNPLVDNPDDSRGDGLPWPGLSLSATNSPGLIWPGVGIAPTPGGPQRPILHAANSAAALRFPAARLDMVRCGLALYGWLPGAIPQPPMALQPVMRLTAPLAAIKTLPAGHGVGYGSTWRATRATRVGIVPIGYADGYPRCLGNAAVMTIAGRIAQVIGRVSMDQAVVDLTEVPPDELAPGATVTVISDDPSAPNSLPALADAAGTVTYELLCRLGRRVRRVYHRGDWPGQTEPDGRARLALGPTLETV